MHGPCHVKKDSPCLDENGKCTKRFPKAFCEKTQASEDGYPQYKRPKNSRTITVNGIQLDNRWVVPFNKILSKLFNCHINVEICTSVSSVKYLYKYVYKGHDAAFAEFHDVNFDEITNFVNARYVSASEAIWRIYGFDLHEEYPTIQRLTVHLPEQQVITFDEQKELEETLEKNTNTTLTEWFKTNEKDSFARNILYDDFPKYYTWNTTSKKWNRRKRIDEQKIGRMYFVQPSEGERYFKIHFY